MAIAKTSNPARQYTADELEEIRSILEDLPSTSESAFTQLRRDGVIYAARPRQQLFPSKEQPPEPARIVEDPVDPNCRHFYREGLMQVPPGLKLVPVKNAKVWTPNGPVDPPSLH